MIKHHSGRNIPFTTIQDVYKKSQTKPIVLFGAGNIAEKTERLLTGKKNTAIIIIIEIIPASYIINSSSFF